MKKLIIGIVCLAAATAGTAYIRNKGKKKKNDTLHTFRKSMSEDSGDNILFGRIDGEEIGIPAASNFFNSNVLAAGGTGTGKSYNQYQLPASQYWHIHD